MHFLERPVSRGRRLITWIASLTIIALLGLLRTSTEAEFAFASAAIIPVVAVSWAGGLAQGLLVSVLGAGMWVVADLMSGRQFGLAWMPVANGLIRLAIYGFVAYLTARVAMLLARETELATRDALSGLLNRRAFFAARAIEASRAKRYGRPLAVVFIDLDRFKQLNDTRGHDAGDAALKAVAEALRKSLRATDSVGRVGGDEFAILLPEVNLSEVTETANKIGAAIAAALSAFQPVSASMGVAWFDSVGNDFPALIKAADVLMYEIKQERKGGIRVQSCAAGASGESAP